MSGSDFNISGNSQNSGFYDNFLSREGLQRNRQANRINLVAQGTFSTYGMQQGSHYKSPGDYRMDPAVNIVRQNFPAQASQYDSSYQMPLNPQLFTFSNTFPTNSKLEQGCNQTRPIQQVIPYNFQENNRCPLMGELDVTRLCQTDISEIACNQIAKGVTEKTSLQNLVDEQYKKVGKIILQKNEGIQVLGTCTLIAKDLVLLARHSIEGSFISNIKVVFEDIKNQHLCERDLIYAVEDGEGLDYAIVKLKNSVPSDFVEPACLNVDGYLGNETVLFHYPLGGPLKVSVHAHMETEQSQTRFISYHDSEPVSSGGAYFDASGKMGAMHLGTDIKEYGKDPYNFHRYGITLFSIVKKFKESILGKIANGCNYQEKNSIYLLPKKQHNYLISEEGEKSKKILWSQLGKETIEGKKYLKDKKIKLNKDGTIHFSKANLRYIETKYPQIFNETVKVCTGISGPHGKTQQYSITGIVESDHVLPMDVWKKTKNSKMKKVVQNHEKGGQYRIPAITVSYDKHRRLDTTGSSKEAKNFRQYLTDTCDFNLVEEALILCFAEYSYKGIDIRKYKKEVENYLEECVKLEVIDESKKKYVLHNLYR